jgi:hypothetical protein
MTDTTREKSDELEHDDERQLWRPSDKRAVQTEKASTSSSEVQSPMSLGTNPGRQVDTNRFITCDVSLAGANGDFPPLAK